MRKLRPIKSFLAIGWFVLLLTACSFVHPAVGSAPHATSIPLGTIFRSYRAPFSVIAAAWSPDGKHLALGEDDGTVEVLDAGKGSVHFSVLGHRNHVWAAAWSPDGKRIASGSTDGTVQVWDATTGKLVLTYRGHSNGVQAIAWSPDSKRIASGAWDATVQIWDATTGHRVFTYSGHT